MDPGSSDFSRRTVGRKESAADPLNGNGMSMAEFLENVGCVSVLDVFHGITCQQLVRMRREELLQRFKWIPDNNLVATLENGITELRKCIVPGLEVELPEDFPDLMAYLTEHGIIIHTLNRLDDAQMDMKRFLAATESELRGIASSEISARNLIACQLNLKDRLKNGQARNNGADESVQKIGKPEQSPVSSYAQVAKGPGHQSSSGLYPTDAQDTLNSTKETRADDPVARANQSSVKLLARDFLRNHGFYVSTRRFPGKANDYEAELELMEESEIRKLASILSSSNKILQLKLKKAKLDLKLEKNSSPADNPGNGPTETMDVDAGPSTARGTASGFQNNGEQQRADQHDTGSAFGLSSFNKNASQKPAPPPLLVRREALNILLLGETGVGKSTFINAFANYVNYETLAEARNQKILALIPASFSISDENYVDHKVSVGPRTEASSNESLVHTGQSSTQSCRSYVFPSKVGAIRIIDTPGVGDTRGLEQDSLNFANILAYISQYPELHAICILLKPNSARLTAGFRLCVNQLLNNLEKSASQNIIFVFTNARSTFYQPGDTKPVLEETLHEIARAPPFVRIKFDSSTSYCVDNEAFRFLAAISNGLDFLEPDSETFAESWVKSVTECKRLMEHILTLQPHKVQNTVSISQARRLIDDLVKPVADLITEISMNLTRIMEQKKMLEQNRNTTEGLESLTGRLFTSDLEMYREELPYPRTVCVSKNCVGLGGISPDGGIVYKQICHDKCALKYSGNVSGNIGDPALKNCSVFNKSYNCRVCECSYQEHLRITHSTLWREVFHEDLGVKRLLQNARTIDEAMHCVESDRDSYVKEREILLDAMAFFTVFQSMNTISSRGDPFRDCLSDHIRLEDYKASCGAKNENFVDQLKFALWDYETARNKLFSQLSGHESQILTPENVVKYENEIYDLPYHGAKLRSIRDTFQGSRAQDTAASSETVVEMANLTGYGTEATSSIMQPINSYFSSK